jgi:hypothetical protein
MNALIVEKKLSNKLNANDFQIYLGFLLIYTLK